MGKYDMLDAVLLRGGGYIRTSDVVQIGISRTYFGSYVRDRGLERISHGVYKSADAWDDGMYILQTRYPSAVFSHESALFLLNLAEREPARHSVTMKAGTNATRLGNQGVKVYKVKQELFIEGVIEMRSPTGHTIRTYCPERTICDLVRSRRHIEIQDFQFALKEYAVSRERNIPLLLRYAKLFSIEKRIRQYLEVLL